MSKAFKERHFFFCHIWYFQLGNAEAFKRSDSAFLFVFDFASSTIFVSKEKHHLSIVMSVPGDDSANYRLFVLQTFKTRTIKENRENKFHGEIMLHTIHRKLPFQSLLKNATANILFIRPNFIYWKQRIPVYYARNGMFKHSIKGVSLPLLPPLFVQLSPICICVAG